MNRGEVAVGVVLLIAFGVIALYSAITAHPEALQEHKAPISAYKVAAR